MGRTTGLGSPSSISLMPKTPSPITIVAILNVLLPTTSPSVLSALGVVDDGEFASPEFRHRREHLSWHRVLGALYRVGIRVMTASPSREFIDFPILQSQLNL